ncbi:MAG: fibronectin type III domain-containing protein [Thermoanaerobaculia bacterium]|nr:fibronectin type III domain-containing protein [Thermoanaerobaculia bacterium]
MSSRITLVALLGALLLLPACGNKKPPTPPPQILPARTLDLTVQQRGEELLLSFTFPTTTATGLPLGAIAGVEFWEVVREVGGAAVLEPGTGETASPDEDETADEGEAADESETAAEAEGGVEEEPPAEDEEAAEDESETETGDDTAGDRGELTPERLAELARIDPTEFAAAATVRATLTGPELDSAIQGDKISARFPLGRRPAGASLEAHHFAVKVLSPTGLGSPFSNIASIVRRETPPPPTEFTVEPDSVGVRLGWFFAGQGPPAPAAEEEGEEQEDAAAAPAVAVEEIAEPEVDFEAFHVYRRGARERSYGPPLVRVAQSGRQYVDRTARFGEAYIYAVAAVIEAQPRVETALSTEREIEYTDRFPPPPPRNLVTLAERGSVRVLWDASTADDVDGYLIYRDGGDGEFTALNEEPLRELEYTDRDVRSGGVYRYRVVAVDQSGNRSVESRVSEARVP